MSKSSSDSTTMHEKVDYSSSSSHDSSSSSDYSSSSSDYSSSSSDHSSSDSSYSGSDTDSEMYEEIDCIKKSEQELSIRLRHFYDNQAYGTFYSLNCQRIKKNRAFLFQHHQNTKHIGCDKCGEHLKIYKSGMYVVSLSVQFEKESQIAWYINDRVVKSSIMNHTKHAVETNVLLLKEGDCLTLKNYKNHKKIKAHNLIVSIWRIAPICDDDYHSCSSSSSESECSSSSSSSSSSRCSSDSE